MAVDPFAIPENKLDTLGLFSWDPSGSGELARTDREARTHGRQFTTSPAKAGLGPEVTFSKFSSIHVGDQYTSPEQRRRQYDNEKKQNMLCSNPFKPTSPPKRSSGHGTIHHGVFQKYPYMKVSDDYDHGAPFNPRLPPKNFYTSPAKKGSYGNVGVNIGGKLDGVVGELGYKASPPMAKEAIPKSANVRGFHPASPAKQGTHGYIGLNIGGSPKGVMGEYCYQSDGRSARSAYRSKFTAQPTKPFLPSSPPKFGSGVHGPIGRFPEYVADPETERFDMARSQKTTEKSKIIGGVFRPAGVPKSTFVTAHLPQTTDTSH